MGKKSLALVMAALLIVGVVGVISAQEIKKGKESITLPLSAAKAVTFAHHAHQAKAAPCDNCHKFFPQEEGVVARLKGSGQLERGKVMGNCRACHKERQARPDDCVVCHRG